MGADSPAVQIVGRYTIHDTIAAGGMGTVRFGRLIGPVGFTRTVVIKQLHQRYARDPDCVAMFTDEARLAARIQHPNVVQTLDVAKSGGELFLVMDYIRGEALSRLLHAGGGPVPLRVVTSILCGVLHGLHAAHEAKSDQGKSLGIVHRDVSPQNVLVGTDGIARVLDFGVAKAIERLHSTGDSRLKGKLAYMAPEQLESRVSRRTDIFAASIVLWETLTGQRLFAAKRDVEIIQNILDKKIDKPSTLLAPQEVESVDRAGLDRLDAVTLRGLERRPEDRFESARDMALALEGCFGVASPTEVGRWVEATAGAVLDERARRVAEIESQAFDSPASSTQPTLVGAEGTLGATLTEVGAERTARDSSPPSMTGTDTSPPSSAASTAGVSSGIVSPPASRNAVAFAAAAILAAAVAAFALATTKTSDGGDPTPSAHSSVTSVASVARPSSARDPSLPTPATAENADPRPVAATDAAVRTEKPAPNVVRPPPAKPLPPASAPTSDDLPARF